MPKYNKNNVAEKAKALQDERHLKDMSLAK